MTHVFGRKEASAIPELPVGDRASYNDAVMDTRSAGLSRALAYNGFGMHGGDSNGANEVSAPWRLIARNSNVSRIDRFILPLAASSIAIAAILLLVFG